MNRIECPGWPAEWVNAWLAAVGTTVLDDRIRLHWTAGGTPVAVLSASELDPVDALVESWPDAKLLEDLPIATRWRKSTEVLKRKVSVDAFAERARAARGHARSWALSSTMTDLCVDKAGEVAHAPFDPAGTGPMKWLHHRLTRVHENVGPASVDRIRRSLTGRSERVENAGLGFDQSRLGSLSDDTNMWVDPVVEVLAFFGLAVLPVRGRGSDGRLDRANREDARQRGWRKVPGTSGSRFTWPAWQQPLDLAGIDALLDIWNPDRRSRWPRVGVHAAWRSVRYRSRGSNDPTRAFGAERL